MLKTKKAELQDQVTIYLIPALNFRLNMGLGLKTHAVRALKGLCQVLWQHFALCPQPSPLLRVQGSTASLRALRASSGSWNFGAGAQGQPRAGATGGCHLLLLTVGRSSRAALTPCGDGGLPCQHCGDPPVAPGTQTPRQPSLYPGSWRRERGLGSI